MTHLPQDAMLDLAYWSEVEDLVPAKRPVSKDSYHSVLVAQPKTYAQPELFKGLPLPGPSRKANLEAIEKIVAFFVCGGKHTSDAELATIIAAPMVQTYAANNPLLKTLRELIDAEAG